MEAKSKRRRWCWYICQKVCRFMRWWLRWWLRWPPRNNFAASRCRRRRVGYLHSHSRLGGWRRRRRSGRCRGRHLREDLDWNVCGILTFWSFVVSIVGVIIIIVIIIKLPVGLPMLVVLVIIMRLDNVFI